MSYRSLPAGRDAPPLRQRAEWDTVASGVAETMQGYLAQLMLTRRPATVRQVEGTLREFALFLSQEAADVSRVSDIVAVTSRPIDSGWQSAQPMDTRAQSPARPGQAADDSPPVLRAPRRVGVS